MGNIFKTVIIIIIFLIPGLSFSQGYYTNTFVDVHVYFVNTCLLLALSVCILCCYVAVAWTSMNVRMVTMTARWMLHVQTQTEATHVVPVTEASRGTAITVHVSDYICGPCNRGFTGDGYNCTCK